MADGERKSSEELIREANSKLRASQGVPDPVPSAAESDGPVAPVEPRRTANFPPEQGLISEQSAMEPAGQQPARVSRISGRVVSWVVGITVFAGIGLFSSLSDASRDGSGEIVGGGDLDVMTLQVGDCFDDPAELDEVVFDVPAVPCSEPHDNEVYSVQSVAGVFGTFPGVTALQEYSYEVCVGEPFGAYVGTAYLDSALEVFTFTPSEESWAQDDREVVCVLYRLDFSTLTGTARDSGL